MSTMLALDLATCTGWAVGPAGAVPSSGEERIGAPGIGIGEFLDIYGNWLADMITVHAPQVVIFEAPIIRYGDGGAALTSIDTARKLLCLAGLTEMIAFRRGIPEHLTLEADASTVCKFFTGRGHFGGDRQRKKNLVISRCREMGWEPAGENAADALALWRFAESKFFPRARVEQTALERAANDLPARAAAGSRRRVPPSASRGLSPQAARGRGDLA